jgi:type I restriction enzyme S subunit
MACEWKRTSLREAGVTLIDCDHRTPPAADSGFPYVAIPQLKEGRIVLNDVRRISPEHFAEWTRKAKPQHHDVILSRRCNPGETAFVPAGLECALGQNLVLLRADGTKLFPPFLRWLLNGSDWWEQVGTFINVGAIFNSLKCADIPNFKMPLPPLVEQQAIAGVLGALDDKIELNRRMNATLEAMARALFQSWFVDFDPVRAKLDGRPPVGMDAATAALFPSHFDHKAEGVVPIGWQLKRWGDIATLKYGKSIRNYRESSGRHRVFGTNGPIGFHDEALCNSAGIVIGRKGAYRGVHYSSEPFFVIDTAFYLNPKVTLDLKWAYYELLRFDINSMDSGSAIPSTSRDDFYGIPVIVPSSEVQDAFGKIVGRWFEKIFANDHQSRTLATLRDTLLPKLLSGELSVAGAGLFTSTA